tara:strand:+ start:3268 stop:3624 length:357 start_codon:yes stop_codon:yes gene_type:complete
MRKKIYLVLGLMFMSIGILGYILPILPGTIFMILAAYCFLHSSETLYKKIVEHPTYGYPIKQYIENNFIQRNTKIIILLSIWLATLTSIYYVNLNLYLNIAVLILAILGSIVVMKANS